MKKMPMKCLIKFRRFERGHCTAESRVDVVAYTTWKSFGGKSNSGAGVIRYLYIGFRPL